MSATGESRGGAALLSSRGASVVNDICLLDEYFATAFANPYHPQKNPEGIINLGTAVNRLMEEELRVRLCQGDALDYSSAYQHYYDFDGTQEIKDALLGFLKRHFLPQKPVLKEELVVLNGVGSSFDALSHALCEPGDVIITPSPGYYSIFVDFHSRAGTEVVTLDLKEEEDFELRAEALESLIASLRAQGRRVRAFLLVHPNNPLGDIYSEDLLSSLLDVCARHEIHFISDEIYILCSFPTEAGGASRHPVRSVLSLPHPDPQRTHVLWGISKDFGLPGFRLGVVISRCRQLTDCLRRLTLFLSTPHLIQHATAKLLSDEAWCDDMYVPLNAARLGRAYDYARGRLEAMGVQVRKTQAALFVWFCVKDFMAARTVEEEIEISNEIMASGVFVIPGSQLRCVDPGWFRVLVSLPEEELQKGFNRVESVLKRRKSLKKAQQ